MKVFITGANGMLARAILKKKPAEWKVLGTDIDVLDISSPRAVERALGAFQPDLVINCAAFTRVDDCEARREEAFKVNAEGAGYLAEVCGEHGTFLVHFSTDYIFDGRKSSPYQEDDRPAPINVYGESKLEGERRGRKSAENHLIIRTQWLYGDGGSHFVRTILNLAGERDLLKVVNDQTGSPTWTEDLADGAIGLIGKRKAGTYHLVNSGSCTWFDFASEIIKSAGLDTKILPCTSAEYPRPAKRPAYAVLSTEKAARILGGPLPDWQAALKIYMKS